MERLVGKKEEGEHMRRGERGKRRIGKKKKEREVSTDGG